MCFKTSFWIGYWKIQASELNVREDVPYLICFLVYVWTGTVQSV